MGRASLSFLLTIALVVAALAAAVDVGAVEPAAERETPRLRAALEQLPAGQQIAVVVTLKDQAAVDGDGKVSRRTRQRAAVDRLLQHANVSQAPLRRLLAVRRAQGRASRVQPFWVFNGLALEATADVVHELAARPQVALVDLDIAIAAPATEPAGLAAIEPNVADTKAPALWAAGYRGQGVVVANLDTGVDVTHPDLGAAFRGGTNSWFDPNGEHPATPTDVSGHGTSTMGVIVGGGAGGSAIGVAPDAKWIAAKIFNDRGVATASGIHAAFQWVLDPDRNPATPDAPNVVSNSWTMQSIGCDLSFQTDLRSLRAAGILPLFAAGNFGPASATDTSPGNNPAAFAVGATDATAGVVAPFSSRGPSGCGEPSSTYPELVAPGVGIRSADLFASWRTDSGTSLAAPHAAGTLALLASAFPDLSADRQASALRRGAADLGVPGDDNDYGSGRLDALGAYDWLRRAPDFTLGASPASQQVAAGASATYSLAVGSLNGFTGDVALTLSGLAPTQASWSFVPATVPGGSGTSQLSVTPAATLAPGSYPLTITASNGVTTRTAAVTLVVKGPADFGLAATPPGISVTRGGTATYTVSATALNGFTGNVALAASGVPGGTRVTFSRNPLPVPGSAAMNVKTSTSTRTGNSTLTVTGTSGTLRHQVAVTLTVR